MKTTIIDAPKVMVTLRPRDTEQYHPEGQWSLGDVDGDSLFDSESSPSEWIERLDGETFVRLRSDSATGLTTADFWMEVQVVEKGEGEGVLLTGVIDASRDSELRIGLVAFTSTGELHHLSCHNWQVLFVEPPVLGYEGSLIPEGDVVLIDHTTWPTLADRQMQLETAKFALAEAEREMKRARDRLTRHLDEDPPMAVQTFA